MATGFPDPSTISPQVIVNEVDNTLIATTTNPHNAAIVGFASKGAINTPVVVTSRADLYTKFGRPHPQDGDPNLIYAAEIILQNANSVILVRAADIDPASGESAQVASVNVPAAGGPVKIISNTVGAYVFANNAFFRWRLNGVLSAKTLVVLAGTYSVSQLACTLNDQLSSQDGIKFVVSTINTIEVDSTNSYGLAASIELVSIQDALYGPGSVSGLGTLMQPAAITGAASKYPNNAYTSAGTYDFTGLTGLNLQIVIDGTDNTAIDGTVQVIDLSALEGMVNHIADVVNEINTQINNNVIPGGFIASATGNNLTLTTAHAGRDAKLLVKVTSTADTIFGFSNSTAIGSSPSGTTGDVNTYTDGIVTGSANGNGAISFTVNADSPGIEGNNTTVAISNSTSGDGTFTIQVATNGVVVETWGGLTKDSTNSRYVGTYVVEVSNYISVSDNTNVGAMPLAGTYTLSGGVDGIPSDPENQDLALIGDPAAQTGMQVLSDPDQVNIDFIACPGHTSTSIATALIALAEQRDDCLAVIDPPFGLSPTEIVQWQNGTHPLNSSRFDSHNAALFYPWAKYGDISNAVNVWIPPSGPVLSTFAYSDTVGGGPWMAAAGETRGLVPAITDVFSYPTLTERNSMYGNQNAVNPIINKNGIGLVIFGNKTLQRLPTERDRINTVRTVFYIKKQIQSQGEILLFEQNDQKLWNRFIAIATNILETIKQSSGIAAYFVQCDATLNTPDTIERHELVAIIGIQATPDVEFIYTTITLNNLGSF